MNREIKFRAWDGEMMLENSSKFMVDISDGSFYDVVGDDYYNFPVMQYTGLKDKNGKEIYSQDCIEDEDGKVYLVDMREGSWAAVHPPENASEREGACKWDYLYDLLGWVEIEVIGNRFENPELLEKFND